MRPLLTTCKILVLAASALVTGCAHYTAATGLSAESEAMVLRDGRQVEFIGVPIVGDHDTNSDLDFVLRVESVGKVIKIRCHEHSQIGNSALLVNLHIWVNEIVDRETIMVAGKFKRGHFEQGLEYGSLELDRIAFLSDSTGFDTPYSTNPPKSTYYSFAAAFAVIFGGFIFR